MKLHTFITLLICAQTNKQVSAFSSGADISACSNFFPSGHQTAAQTGSHSYTITAQDNYTAGETMTVTISGATFRGFLIKARRTDGSESGVGTFADSTGAQARCTGNFAATHRNNNDKESIELTYTAPDPAVGDLVFQATVVQERVIFYQDVLSSTMSGPTEVEEENDTSTVEIGSNPAEINFDSCGSDKGCFRKPSSCSGNDCNAAATWRLSTNDDSKVVFELIGRENGWIALGFSEDEKMGSDNVYACIHYDGQVTIQNSYNEGRSNGPLDNPLFGISNAHIVYENGVIRCTFERDVSVSSSRRKRATDSEKTVDLDQDFYLLLGHGPNNFLGTGEHEAIPLISSDKVTVTVDYIEIGGAAQTLYQVHGILMLVSWMGLISISLIIARHFKPAWPGLKVSGKDLWFPIHVGMNVVVILCTITAFVIIFVAVGSYSSFGSTAESFHKAHPPIGIAVMALAIINPIMAIFRPKPDSDKRFIFNIAHWMVGTAAEILGVINIFFGVTLARSESFVHGWVFYLLIAFVVLHFIVSVTLEIHRCFTKSDNSGKSDGMPGESVESNMFDNADKNLRFKYIVLTIFVILNVGLVVAMVVGMVIPK